MISLETILAAFSKKKGLVIAENIWNNTIGKVLTSSNKDNKNDSKSPEINNKKNLNNNCEETLKILKKSVCFFQGDFLECSLKASDNHRNLRLYLDKTPKDEWNDEILVDLCSKLINHLSDSTSSAFSRFERDLSNIFKVQGRTTFADPRICLKSIENIDSEVYIYEMERGREGSSKKWSKFPVSLNTGFDEVLKSGNYYSCADIPAEANSGRYKNKRLSLRAVQNYVQGLSAHSDNNNNEWGQCWDTDDESSSPDPSSCYKSTLIIPLTLSHSGIGERALQILGMSNLHHSKTTVGFLCFDHQNSDYFTDSDRRIAYTYADNLSMYLFTRINYIRSSTTFAKATDFLRNKGKIDEIYKRLKTEGNNHDLGFIKPS